VGEEEDRTRVSHVGLLVLHQKEESRFREVVGLLFNL
jgi:hypothetical protein